MLRSPLLPKLSQENSLLMKEIEKESGKDSISTEMLKSKKFNLININNETTNSSESAKVNLIQNSNEVSRRQRK